MRIVLEEGLEASWERHRQNQAALIAGLEAMGIELFVRNPADRLPTVTSVVIPAGIDGAKARGRMLNEFNIEIAGGLGDFKTTMWRIGLMGYSSQRANVLLFLDVPGARPARSGHEASGGRGNRRGRGKLRARRAGARRSRRLAR